MRWVHTQRVGKRSYQGWNENIPKMKKETLAVEMVYTNSKCKYTRGGLRTYQWWIEAIPGVD